jgi:CheY-like chemotaxis protein
VTITCDRVASGIQITVKDSGAGIAPEHLGQIFERFRQVDSSTTRAHGGLGLGLAIVRHLVEAHGGSVAAESAGVGLGATFTVSLPIQAVSVRPPSEIEIEIAPSTIPPPEEALHIDQTRVLIVDDDADSLDVLREVLEAAGAEVTTVSSAREALRVIDANESTVAFEIIVSDIGMPEMDGHAFIRRVRASAKGADIPAIALTAYARASDATLAVEAGFQEHLVKPIDEQRLLRAVKTWSRVSLRAPREGQTAATGRD